MDQSRAVINHPLGETETSYKQRTVGLKAAVDDRTVSILQTSNCDGSFYAVVKVSHILPAKESTESSVKWI